MLPREKRRYDPELEDASYPGNHKKKRVTGTQNGTEELIESPILSPWDQQSKSSVRQHHTIEEPEEPRGLQAISESIDTEFSDSRKPPKLKLQTNLQNPFFSSSKNFEVANSQFNSFRDHVSTGNVIINVNQLQDRETISVHLPQVSASHNVRVIPHLELDPFNRPADLPIPVRTNAEIYFRHLLALGRGSPLWIPEPSTTLPIEYQKAGIGIGDVGLLTESGGFDFLFNVYQPQNDPAHPINPRTLPDGFITLEAPEERDLSSHIEFKDWNCLTSSDVHSQYDELLGLSFESSAKNGAILTMPGGASSTDLDNTAVLRKYVSQNVENWYKYSREVRGRSSLINGDLRLVIGKTSSTAWGMAAFVNDLDLKGEAASFSLKLCKSTPKGGDGSALNPGYAWEYSGNAQIKSGPAEREVEKLREFDRLRGDEGQVAYENQSLFIRTINVTLNIPIRRRGGKAYSGPQRPVPRFTRKKSKSALTSFTTQGPHFGQFESPRSLTGTSHSSLDDATSTSGSSSMGFDPSNKILPVAHEDSQTMESHRHPSHSVGKQDLQNLSYGLALGTKLHPSKIINDYLLYCVPEAIMAITEDNDWISVLQTDDLVFPSRSVLLSRIQHMRRFSSNSTAGRASLGLYLDSGSATHGPNNLAVSEEVLEVEMAVEEVKEAEEAGQNLPILLPLNSAPDQLEREVAGGRLLSALELSGSDAAFLGTRAKK